MHEVTGDDEEPGLTYVLVSGAFTWEKKLTLEANGGNGIGRITSVATSSLSASHPSIVYVIESGDPAAPVALCLSTASFSKFGGHISAFCSSD